MKNKRQIAKQMVGCACFHRGEEGMIIGADTTSYAEPMVRVLFADGRIATLKTTEVGAA